MLAQARIYLLGVLLTMILLGAASPIFASWAPGFNLPGTDGDVNAMLVYDDGLYFGGAFTRVNDQPAHYLAKWDGSTITDLDPDGLILGSVYDLVEWRGELYVLSYRSVFHWTGTEFVSIANGDGFYAMTVWNDQLIVGGDFDEVEDVTAPHVAAWDGIAWSSLADGVGPDTTGVTDLTTYEGDLIAIGFFRDDNRGNPLDGIAKYDGTSWGTISHVANVESPWNKNAVAVHDGDLYVSFCTYYYQTIEGVSVNNLARWDGHAWHNEGRNFWREPDFLLSHPQGLVVSGQDLTWPFLGDALLFEGGAIKEMGGSTVGDVMASAFYQDQWYFGGAFRLIEYLRDEIYCRGLAIFDGQQWHSFPGSAGNGIRWSIYAMTMIGNDLYAGGRIRTAGGTNVDDLARFDGQEWHRVSDSSPHGDVYALCNWNGQLVVSGSYGVYLLLEDGQWQSMGGGSGTDFFPHALYEFEGDLIAGAWVDLTVPTPVAFRWTGSDWENLGVLHSGETDCYVHQFLEYEGHLMAVGKLWAYSNVCYWGGAGWHRFQGGASHPVYAAAEYHGDLVIGGEFTEVGGEPINNIARWHDGVWLPMGAGLNDWVTGLAASDHWVYACGDFDYSGSTLLHKVASWNEWTDTWNDMDGGFNDEPYCILETPAGLFLGGTSVDLTRAIDNISIGIAKWEHDVSHTGQMHPPEAFTLAAPYPNPFNPCTNLEFSLEQPGFVRLEIFDARGRLVRQLLAAQLPAGLHHQQWDGSDDNGRQAAAGTYFARLKANEKMTTSKLTIVK